eukprot:790653-Rhodomonas_salina.1
MALGSVTHVICLGDGHGLDDPYYVDKYNARMWAGSQHTWVPKMGRKPLVASDILSERNSPFPALRVFSFTTAGPNKQVLPVILCLRDVSEEGSDLNCGGQAVRGSEYALLVKTTAGGALVTCNSIKSFRANIPNEEVRAHLLVQRSTPSLTVLAVQVSQLPNGWLTGTLNWLLGFSGRIVTDPLFFRLKSPNGQPSGGWKRLHCAATHSEK